MSSPITLVGLDPPEAEELSQRLRCRVIAFNMLPRLRLVDDQLFVRPRGSDEFEPTAKVVFHGIFEDDLPILTVLALWGGPCFPNARGMLDCRERVPALARCRTVSRFASLPRSYGRRGEVVSFDRPTVAKWGEWHCGEGKEMFTGEWECAVPTLFEPFVPGEAVRVQLVGERAWQIRMGGDGWKKSIHGPGSELVSPDTELLEDMRNLQRNFGLEICAGDYIVTSDGTKHLLELNHIPNVTEFETIRRAYLETVAEWAGRSQSL